MSKRRGINTVSGLGRDPGLATGAAIAEGAANFVNSFTSMRRAQAVAQAHAQQMQAIAQLRQMQAQKLMADMQDKTIDLSKINLMAKASQAGFDVPSSVQKNVWTGFVNKIQSPTDAMVAHKMLDHLTGGAASQGLGPQGPETGQQGPQAPAQSSYKIRMSPAEYNYATKSIAANASMANTNTKAKTAMEQLQEKGQQQVDLLNARLDGQLQLAREHNLGAVKIAKIRGEYAKQLKDIAGQYNLDIADTRAGATVDAARIRANGMVGAAKVRAGASGKSPQDQAAKSILDQIKQTQSAIDKAGQQNGPVPLDPFAVKQQRDFLNNKLNSLYDQYQQKTKIDLRVQPPAQPAPAPSAAAPGAAPAKPVMGPVQQSVPIAASPAAALQGAAGTPQNPLPFASWKTAPAKSIITGPDGKLYQKLDDAGNAAPYTPPATGQQ